MPDGLLQDRWVLFFEWFWLPLNLTIAALVWWLASFEMMIYFVALRAGVGLFFHWLVAYIVHVWGHKEYSIEGASEEGRNHLVLGWITFGEAYHNNHHKYPGSAAVGLKRFEFDLAFLTIQALEKIGLAYDVQIASDHYSIL